MYKPNPLCFLKYISPVNFFSLVGDTATQPGFKTEAKIHQ